MATPPESAHYRGIADALEEAVTQKIDRIAQLLKSAEIRQAVTETRKEFLLNQAQEELDDPVLDEDVLDEDGDDEYDEFDWTTE
ncbi:hypothetical protein [Pseudomonas sp. NPDC096950]|uniref:hypothetical protein n=1 Tax=Pseudomonas sp. NPDC096950 TaxID=3364485 RepID=UPI00383A473B